MAARLPCTTDATLVVIAEKSCENVGDGGGGGFDTAQG
jgi:hypothetical protein